MWHISGTEPFEYPAWRKSYLDRRIREIRQAQAPEEAEPEIFEEEADDLDQKLARAASGSNTKDNPTTAVNGSGAGLLPLR